MAEHAVLAILDASQNGEIPQITSYENPVKFTHQREHLFAGILCVLGINVVLTVSVHVWWAAVRSHRDTFACHLDPRPRCFGSGIALPHDSDMTPQVARRHPIC